MATRLSDRLTQRQLSGAVSNGLLKQAEPVYE